jgi:hypothetical protein
VPMALARAVRRALDAVPHLGEDPLAARRRVFGAAWVDAIEEIRRRVPEDAAYALIDAQPVEQGALYWVRFDLAPRRALFLGRQRNLPGLRRLQSRIPAGVRWVVVTTGSEAPPRLLTRQELLRELERRREHRRGAAHAPAEGQDGGGSGTG